MATTYAEIAQKLATKKGQAEEELKTTNEPTKKASLKLLIQKITAALQKLKDSQKMHPEAEDPTAQMQGGQQQMPQQMPMPQQQMAQQQVPQQQMPMPQPGMQQQMQQPMGYAKTGGHLPQYQSTRHGLPYDHLSPYENISMDFHAQNYGDYGKNIHEVSEGKSKSSLLRRKEPNTKRKTAKFYWDLNNDFYDDALTSEDYSIYEKVKYDKDGNPKKIKQRKWDYTGDNIPWDVKKGKTIAKWKKKRSGREKYTVYDDTEGYTEKITGSLPKYFSGGDVDWGEFATETGQGALQGAPGGIWGALGMAAIKGGSNLYSQYTIGGAKEEQEKLNETAAKEEEAQKDKYKALTQFIKPAEPTDPFYTASLPKGKSWQSIESGNFAPALGSSSFKTPFYQSSSGNLPDPDPDMTIYDYKAAEKEAQKGGKKKNKNKKPPLTPAEKAERDAKRTGQLEEFLYMMQKYGPVFGNLAMAQDKDKYPGFYTPTAPLNYDTTREYMGEAADAFREGSMYNPRNALTAAAHAKDAGIYNAQNAASPSVALALQNKVTGDHADRLGGIYADADNINASRAMNKGQGLAQIGQLEAGLAGQEYERLQNAYGLGTKEQANVWNQGALLDATQRQFYQQALMDQSKGAQTDKLMAGKEYNDLIRAGLLGSMFPNYSYDANNPLGGISFTDYASGVSDT